MDVIVIGEESFVDRPERVDFQRSGTYHVLVVSGMNVSILAMFALWTLLRSGLNEIAASACAIVLILASATLTNIGPPVWRAALMFAVYLATRLLYRDRAMLNALGAAALALLIVDPEALFGASFQMTFLCVGLVAGAGVPLLERTIEPYRQGLCNLDALAYDRSLPPRVTQFRLDLGLLLNRIGTLLPGRVPRWIFLAGLRGLFGFAELIVISAVLQVGLALPMAYYFHRATSVAMPANLLVVPFLQLLMPADHAGHRCQLRKSVAGENSGGDCGICAPRHRRNCEVAGWHATGGRSRGYADPGCNCFFGDRDSCLCSINAATGLGFHRWPHPAHRQRSLDLDSPTSAANSARRSGDDCD